MAIGDIFSDLGISNLNVGSIVDKLFLYGGVFIVIILIGAVVGLVLYVRKKNKGGSQVNKKIGWWEEVQGRLVPLHVDDAEEIAIPGTNLRVFYIKTRDMWLPRFTRGITKDLYYVVITPQREMVNFDMPSISADMKKANIGYDHTDMRWAAENTREFIKRNYKDKAQKWWQLYQGPITTAIYILVMTFSFMIIIYFLRGAFQDLGVVADKLGVVVDKINTCVPQGSGITPAA